MHMYLTSLYLTLNLDTEVSSFDRERVLRSLRDKLKTTFGSKITLRTDDGNAIVIAFLEDKLERIAPRCEALLARVDEAGEARVLSSQRQTFAWFEGEFTELPHESSYEDLGETHLFVNRGLSSNQGKTIVYSHPEEHLGTTEDEDTGHTFRRPSRRQFRIPVRK